MSEQSCRRCALLSVPLAPGAAMATAVWGRGTPALYICAGALSAKTDFDDRCLCGYQSTPACAHTSIFAIDLCRARRLSARCCMHAELFIIYARTQCVFYALLLNKGTPIGSDPPKRWCFRGASDGVSEVFGLAEPVLGLHCLYPLRLRCAPRCGARAV